MSVHALHLLRLQQRVLESVATGADTEEALDQLCRLVENLVPESVCTSMRYDARTRTLDLGAAPCAPPGLHGDLKGVPVSAVTGSCAAAVLTGEPVYVSDTAMDERWSTIRDVAEKYGIRACWSHPIRGRSAEILGTFAISRGTVGEPDEFHRSLLETASRLAGIAIERSRAEEEQRTMQAKMQHSQKLESLGVLAGGIAHDFNNLLVGILGNADLARRELPEGTRAVERLDSIVDTAKGAADLCRQMLAYAGKGQLQLESVDLNSLVTHVGRLLEASLPKNASLHFDLTPDLPPVDGDPTQIRQILLNLVTNGSEALEEAGGDVVVETGLADLAREQLDGFLLGDEVEPGRFVYVEVSDDGRGMDDETRLRIFDPFFSTKFAGRGLGLAAVQGIVRRHGGALEVRSRPGRGCRIRVIFPEAVRRADAPVPEAAAPRGAVTTGTILVVDDETVVRDVARDMLRSAGFRVITAVDGEDGLAVYRARRDEIDCVVLDLTMPKLGGEEVFRELTAMDPRLPILISSGYTEEELVARFAGREVSGFVGKPFERDTFIDGVVRAMERKAAL
ncbi:MAG: response regulator [Gemmatimonadetes bacterium]|nr:response regulator [Gemmatimonadota bacterium]